MLHALPMNGVGFQGFPRYTASLCICFKKQISSMTMEGGGQVKDSQTVNPPGGYANQLSHTDTHSLLPVPFSSLPCRDPIGEIRPSSLPSHWHKPAKDNWPASFLMFCIWVNWESRNTRSTGNT